MPTIYIQYKCALVEDVFAELQAAGLLGQFFSPRYFEKDLEWFPDTYLEPIHDVFHKVIKLSYTEEEKREYKEQLAALRGVAFHFGPDDHPPEYDLVYRLKELVKGEELIPELGLTVSRLPDIQQEIQERLVEVQRQHLRVIATARGNTLINYEQGGELQLGSFCRQFVPCYNIFRSLNEISFFLCSRGRPGRVSVDIGFDMAPWLGDREGKKLPVPPFSHRCRQENWRRFMGHLRWLVENGRLEKCVEARLREYRPYLRGLGVFRAFLALPGKRQVIG
ncbi:MAG TPA: hypothetical protein VNK04_17420 [Gemmataceae bacterium]|nr:hypothetical protein [Gemmataceae bacterium]